MLAKISLSARSVKVFFTLTTLAALTFNNWILGFLLNANLFNADGSISELSSAGQPHAVVFRTLDTVSGLLLVILAIWWYHRRELREPGGAILFFGALILGLSNISDALMPLGCSETLNSACKVPISLSLHHLVLPSHAYSSAGVGIGYFLLPLGGWIYAKHQNMKAFMILSQVAFVLNLLLFASILREYAAEGVTVKASGLMQQFQMGAVGLWLLAWGHLYKQNKKKALRS